ncbi:hypothetical protein PVAP13_7KG021078 [Panicum virgatum]|uniref:Uncharacterized protein n=1 Tax=Panicum virgatum TaxID=38727 RepID=A0A8T0QEH3_PANVG|nr:hypothetical protein PVAP13_7KG021078 [Panicum virgatum]
MMTTYFLSFLLRRIPCPDLLQPRGLFLPHLSRGHHHLHFSFPHITAPVASGATSVDSTPSCLSPQSLGRYGFTTPPPHHLPTPLLISVTFKASLVELHRF